MYSLAEIFFFILDSGAKIPGNGFTCADIPEFEVKKYSRKKSLKF